MTHRIGRALQVFWAVFRLRFQNMLAYRTAAWAGVCTQGLFGLVFISIYAAFYRGATDTQSFTLEQAATYIWLQQAFLAMIYAWFRDAELGNSIIDGSIACELCRPADLYGLWFARLLAQRMAAATLRGGPILLLGALLPPPYRMALPPSWAAFGLFLLSMLLGCVLLVAISMTIYTSIFKTFSLLGSFALAGTVIDFLSGNILPLPLMPEWMQAVSNWLPFRYTADFALRVYAGHIPVNEALLSLVVQIAWLVALVALGRWLFGRELKKLVLQGG